MKNSLVILCFVAAGLALSPTVVSAQAPSPETAKKLGAMAKLSELEGVWEGRGWVISRSGEKESFRSTETVQSRLGGMILEVEGIHYSREEEGSEEEIAFHAFGILSSGDADGDYVFSTFLANGHSAVSDAKLEDGQVTWSPPAPPGIEIRYVIDLRKTGVWHEQGFMSRDGETWTPFFEMKLSRKGK